MNSLDTTTHTVHEEGIVLGEGVEYCLTLARQHGLADGIPSHTLPPLFLSPIVSENQTQEESPLPVPCITKSPSLRLISLLKEITQIQDSIDEIDCKLNRLLLDKGSSDFLHIDCLDAKQKQVDILTEHFSVLVQNTSKLVTQLQKVSADSSFKVEACYHKDVVTSVSLLVDILNKLPEHAQKINAIREFKLKENPATVAPLTLSAQILVDCKVNTQQLQNHLNLRSGENQ